MVKNFRLLQAWTEFRHQFLVAKKYKLSEIYKTMRDVYGGAYFSKKERYIQMG